jgi:MYXO-CTERM domain-containing protein
MQRIPHLFFAITLFIPIGCGLDQEVDIASADRSEFRIQSDGTVIVDGRVYPDMSAFHASPEFRQGDRRCATPRPDPAKIMNFAPTDCSFTATSIQSDYTPGAIFTIPVVFHVVQRDTSEGYVPEALIRSQLDVLNEDFRAIPDTLGGPGNDTHIQFVLATEDPDGNPTTGINYYTNNTWYQDPGPGWYSAMKDTIGWDTARYFNIYTNDGSGSGTLGYATFPQESAGDYDDGVVLNWAFVGRDAPNGGAYNLGRTATHEVGHYLGLFHTFQDGCGSASLPYNTGDLIADTVAEQEPQFDCVIAPSACGGGDNPIENYMDYTTDACMYRFTAEQANRMRCSMLHYRPTLFQIGGTPTAEFTFVINGATVDFTDQSTDAEGAVVAWQWDFGDGATSTVQNPSHTYATMGSYEVSLTVTNNEGVTATVVHTVAVTVPPIAAFSYTINGLTVDFTDQSTDPDGAVVAWEWHFGDGSTSDDNNPSHTYDAGGTYTVALTVTDDAGNTAAASMSITVSADVPEGGCCQVGQPSGGPNWPALALIGIALLVLRRRRA